MVDSMQIACFHCGLPVPESGSLRVAILGAERVLCCAGCEAVAQAIVGAGLESYYQTRIGPVPLPREDSEREFPETAKSNASLILEGVRCAACLWLIERTLQRLPGVQAEVNYTTQRARVAWTDSSLEKIIAAVRAVGYSAYPYDPRRADELERKERRAALWRLFVAGFGAMQVMMYAFPAYVDEVGAESLQLMRWASLLITTPVLLVSCRPFFSGAQAEIRNGRIGLDTPIALGLAIGFAASAWATVTGAGEVYFDSISMLAFLLLGARYFETTARHGARRMLDPLLRIEFSKAFVPGEEHRVAPGDRFPADGIVLEGRSSADESLLSGESRPVAKRPGDEVLAGSANLEQPVRMRVTRTGADTRAAAVARLAERGVASRPRLVEAADRVARLLTGVIIFAASVAGLLAQDPWTAVAVLVVACPCALALAAPIVLTRASGALLGAGVLMTRARALEALARATDVVLDKTGTLTTGRMAIARTVVLGAVREDRCLQIAASLEATSRHPIAGAFSATAALPVEEAKAFPAQGVEGRVEGRRTRIGTAAFCREICGPQPLAVDAWRGTRVFLADERGWLAVFDLQDELRTDAFDLARELESKGITVHLASGDTTSVVAAMAQRLDIDRFTGAMSAQDKFDYVERLQAAGRVVVMIGDGVNDAPVLARADASFAMGSGADLAQLHADFILLQGNLAAAGDAFSLAKRAMRLVRQNVGWALAYNAVAIPLAAAGLIGPWEAALAMGASSLTVLLNATRPLDAPWKASTSSSLSRSPSYS
jgi:Cu2+-exporting ATPase